MGGFEAILGLVAVITLLAFLCARELAAASKSSSCRSLANFLDIGIIPLIIVFAMIAAVKVLAILA
jgi:hypothetical protein